MYKITRLVAENMGPHKELDIAIQPGLNAIIGPNGVGKSNLVRILMYALTGQVDGGWGSQTALQRVGAASTGFASVYLEGHGKSYYVTRYSTTGTKFPDTLTEVLPDGTETMVAQRRKDVDAFLVQMLGCPLNLLHTMCWARQGQLDALLTGSAATINAFLTGVFNMKHMETIRQALKTSLDTVAVLPASAQQMLQEAKRELEGIRARERNLQGIDAIRDTADKARKEYEQFLASRDWSKITPKEDHTRKVSQLEHYIQSLCESMPESMEEVPSQERTSAEIVQSMIAIDNEISAHNLALERAQAAMKATDAEISVIKTTVASITETRDKNKNELSKKHTKCMLCEGTIGNREKYMKVLSKKLTGHDTLQEYLDACELKLGQLEKQLSDKELEKGTLTKTSAAIKASLDSAIKRRVDLEEPLRKAKLYEAYVANEARRNQIGAAIREQERELQRVLAETVDGDGATDRLASLRAVAEETAVTALAYSTEEVEVKEALKHSKKALKAAESLAKNQQVNSQARLLLTSLREIFGASRAQAIYLDTKIAKLNELLKEHMRVAHMPFEVRLDVDTHVFMYKDPMGNDMPVCRLSGAQKSMASVALQASLLQTAAPNIALLCLDEPAEAADDANVRYMSDMLHKVMRTLDRQAGTGLVITRNQPLIEAADNIIELGVEDE
jgi:DNA repair exonuclease SbcCD ATPase subunit